MLWFREVPILIYPVAFHENFTALGGCSNKILTTFIGTLSAREIQIKEI